MRLRRPGVYEIRWSTRDLATGRRVPHADTVYGSRVDADRALTAKLAEADEGRYGGADMTVGQLLERWFRARQGGWAPKTRDGYRRIVDNDLVPALGKRPMRKLRAHELTDWYLALQENGLSAGTVNRKHAVLRTAFNLAVREGLLAKNPTGAAEAPHEARRKLPAPDTEAMKRLITMADERDRELAAFIFVKGGTGARRGELCALRWSDLHLTDEQKLQQAVLEARLTGESIDEVDAGTMWIGRSISEIPNTPLIEKDTKSHQARWIDLDVPVVLVLWALRHRQAQLAATCKLQVPADGFVFSPAADGSVPWRPGHFTNAWRALRRRAGVTGRLHDVRHFAAILMLIAGVDPNTVAGRLGHADPATTFRFYGDFVRQADRKAARVLGSALDGALELGPGPDAQKAPAEAEAGGSDEDDSTEAV